MDLKSNKLIILDLDETLIHSTMEKLEHPADFTFDKYHVYKRPALEPFLLSIAQHFHLAIWSSAGDDYVNEIVKQMKPDMLQFEFVWARSKCSLKRDYDLDTYYHEKRLSKVKNKGFNIESIIIVDDSPEKARSNYGNAVYVTEFKGDLIDTELALLSQYLITLKDAENIRTIEKRGWRQTLARL